MKSNTKILMQLFFIICLLCMTACTTYETTASMPDFKVSDSKVEVTVECGDEDMDKTDKDEEKRVELLPFRDMERKKYGYMDYEGNIIIQPQFEFADFFTGDKAIVYIDYKYGCISSSGELIIPAIYNDLDISYIDGSLLAGINLKNSTASPVKWLYMDADENVYLKKNGGRGGAAHFSEGLASFSTDIPHHSSHRKWGAIDKKGKFIIKQKYYSLGSFSEGLAYFANLGEELYTFYNEPSYGFLNKNEEIIIEAIYSDAGDFSEGLAPVKLGEKWGFINNQGEVVIPFQYDDTGIFSGGVAAVEENELWGYIDKTGEYVLEPQFKHIGGRYDGYIEVKETSTKFSHYINFQGDIVKPKY